MRTIHEHGAMKTESEWDDRDALRLISAKIDKRYPDFLDNCRRVEGFDTRNVVLFADPRVDIEGTEQYAEVLDSGIDRVNEFLGIDDEQIPRTIMVVGSPEGYIDPRSFFETCAVQIEDNDGRLQPVVYSPGVGFSLGGKISAPPKLRHEYLHSIDHIIGAEKTFYSDMISGQVAAHVYEIFPHLDTEHHGDGEPSLKDVLEHMNQQRALHVPDGLIDIVGEDRVLVYRPSFVGHPGANVQEFCISLLNAACDERFGESLAAMDPHRRRAAEQLHGFVVRLFRQRIAEQGLAA